MISGWQMCEILCEWNQKRNEPNLVGGKTNGRMGSEFIFLIFNVHTHTHIVICFIFKAKATHFAQYSISHHNSHAVQRA